MGIATLASTTLTRCSGFADGPARRSCIVAKLQTEVAPRNCRLLRACRLRGCLLHPTRTFTIVTPDTTIACTAWWNRGLHKRLTTAARVRSQSEKTGGAMSSNEAVIKSRPRLARCSRRIGVFFAVCERQSYLRMLHQPSVSFNADVRQGIEYQCWIRHTCQKKALEQHTWKRQRL